jgi:hypothetical protein
MVMCNIVHIFYLENLFSFLSFFLGSTAQLRPWPPPQNPVEFLGGFSTIFFFTDFGNVVLWTPRSVDFC